MQEAIWWAMSADAVSCKAQLSHTSKVEALQALLRPGRLRGCQSPLHAVPAGPVRFAAETGEQRGRRPGCRLKICNCLCCFGAGWCLYHIADWSTLLQQQVKRSPYCLMSSKLAEA